MSDCGAHTIPKQRDALGRSTGYVYAKNDIPQQQTSISYGTDGRVATAGFTHQGEHKEFTYSYLPGTHLLHTLTHPNGLTLTQSYEPQRDLLTQMDYRRANALIVRRGYTYDILGRPTARDLARYGTETQDTFGYNTRSESPRGLGGGLDNARSGIAPKGRAGNGVSASQPTQPTATRPLAIQKNGTWYTYGWDLTKNICETYRTDGRIDLAYTYTPYGEVSPAHTYDQPLRWSSEYHDVELGLVYYNYRHYNPAVGRWNSYDILPQNNPYMKATPSYENDYLGLMDITVEIIYSYNVALLSYSYSAFNEIMMHGTIINEKLSQTYHARIDCGAYIRNSCVLGLPEKPSVRAEGNHNINDISKARNVFGNSGLEYTKIALYSRREHWGEGQRHIFVSDDLPQLRTEPNLEGGTFYVVDIVSNATAYRDSMKKQQTSMADILRKDVIAAMTSFASAYPIGKFILEAAPYVNHLSKNGALMGTSSIPDSNSAAASVRIVATCCGGNTGSINYINFTSTDLPIGSYFGGAPGTHIAENRGKFTADVKVDINE